VKDKPANNSRPTDRVRPAFPFADRPYNLNFLVSFGSFFSRGPHSNYKFGQPVTATRAPRHRSFGGDNPILPRPVSSPGPLGARAGLHQIVLIPRAPSALPPGATHLRQSRSARLEIVSVACDVCESAALHPAHRLAIRR